MMKLLRSILVLLFVFATIGVTAQVNVRDSAIYTPLVYAGYGFNIVGGDFADMYGNSSTLGAGIGYKTKSNVFFGIEYDYLWGGKVKQGDEILKDILTSDGQLIAQGGEYAIFQFMLRGHMLFAKAGKLFPVFSPNPNSGIQVLLGAGYIQHRMFISVQENNAFQVDGDYKKGYDRLHDGIGLSQSIGYLFLGDSRIWNFYGGLEFKQAWTKNKRDVNFDTRMKDDTQKLDLFFGFKIYWVIPLYRRAATGYYY